MEIAEGAYDLVVLAYLHLPPEAMRAMLARAGGGGRDGGRLVVIGHHVDNHEHGCGGPSNPAVLHDPEWIGRSLDGFDGGACRTRRAPVDTGARRHGHRDRLAGRGGQAARSTSCTVMIWSRRWPVPTMATGTPTCCSMNSR